MTDRIETDAAALIRKTAQDIHHEYGVMKTKAQDSLKELLVGRWAYVKYRRQRRACVICSVSVEHGLSVGVRIKSKRSYRHDPEFLADTQYVWLNWIELDEDVYAGDV